MAAPLPPPDRPPSRRYLLALVLLLIVVVGFLFRESFKPEMATFANDGPLGLVAAEHNRLPAAWLANWDNLNWIGQDLRATSFTITSFLAWLLSPLLFIKFYPALTLLILGLAAFFLFRQLRFAGPVCIAAAAAAALNSDYFSYACWGLGPLTICVASAFLAIAALVSSHWPAWVRITLAGVAVGNSIQDGFDNGVIFSPYIAAVAIAHAWIHRRHSPPARRLGLGTLRAAGIAAVAFVVAIQTLLAALGIANSLSSAQGPASPEVKREKWIFNTTWSLPPIETLRSVIPGLYGYRMDTPDGGQYWGKVGMHPAWDAYWAAPDRNPASAPQAQLRHSGAGHYTGVPIVLLALFGIVQALRKNSPGILPEERSWIAFWSGAALISLLLAFGRFAPFYHFVFQLPVFNNIRNPIKFLHPFNVAVIILGAYGLQALWRGWILAPAKTHSSPAAGLRLVWTSGPVADRRWLVLSLALAAGSILAWLIYGASRSSLLQHLAEVGFPPNDATAIARFSIREVGLFALSTLVSITLILLAFSGWFSSRRPAAAWAFALWIALDLARANTPWVVHYNWHDRYATNPVFDTLRTDPHLARVTGRVPLGAAGQAGELQQTLAMVYFQEWAQHPFQFYNIQSLDVVQMPRMPADLEAYARALASAPVRQWELGNNRFLLSLAPMADALNQRLDPVLRRFRLHTAFTLSQSREGAIQLQTNAQGPFGLIEFTGALPRAVLFDHWRSGVPDEEALALLPSTNFNPHAHLLIAEQAPAPAVETSTQPAGSVVYRSYHPTRFTLETDARTPSILLVNDKHDPHWQVRVDGKPEPLLRANFIMRGVYLPPGKHEVEFRFSPPTTAFWIGVLATFSALGLCAIALNRPPRPHPPSTPPS